MGHAIKDQSPITMRKPGPSRWMRPNQDPGHPGSLTPCPSESHAPCPLPECPRPHLLRIHHSSRHLPCLLLTVPGLAPPLASGAWRDGKSWQ